MSILTRHCCRSNRRNTLSIDITWLTVLFRNIDRQLLRLEFAFFHISRNRMSLMGKLHEVQYLPIYSFTYFFVTRITINPNPICQLCYCEMKPGNLVQSDVWYSAWTHNLSDARPSPRQLRHRNLQNLFEFCLHGYIVWLYVLLEKYFQI